MNLFIWEAFYSKHGKLLYKWEWPLGRIYLLKIEVKKAYFFSYKIFKRFGSILIVLDLQREQHLMEFISTYLISSSRYCLYI